METVRQVVLRAPRRYEDRRCKRVVSALSNGEAACLQVRVYSCGWKFSYKRYFEAVVGAEGDPMGARLYLRWFNMPYVAKMLACGMELSVYGKVKDYGGKRTMANPEFEIMEDEAAGLSLVEAAMGGGGSLLPLPRREGAEACIHTARIVPIYRGIAGMTARSFRTVVWRLLRGMATDEQPEAYDIAPRYPYTEALWDMHFPEEAEKMRKAHLRFALDECFEQQFRVAWRRRRTRERAGQVTAQDDSYVKELLGSLPFSLTEAQKRCVREIRRDMASDRQMNRLLQGDVGSGKTLVALCAMLLAVGSGKTAVLMAPTQILAEQHFENFKRLLRGTDVPLSLRTGDKRDDVNAAILEPGEEDGKPRLIVGTHALLYKKNRPPCLGLAVIDEQHKFGVGQREALIRGGDNPDVLVLTATPIPRTLTLTLYGDLDVSLIDEIPSGRGKVVTVVRGSRSLPRIARFIGEEISVGRQVYIVSPLVEESAASERSSAEGELARWRRLFPNEPIDLLHGRLSSEEKAAVMESFRKNEIRILVATTVVEVGVDVPNASVMLINNADSFGLSQLHQLRGRIGRGGHRGYCILLSDAKAGEAGREKLDILCRTNNGFTLAEEDFRLRGPGDVLGTAQSGLGAVRFPEWITDVRLIHRANREAQAILDRDPDLREAAHAPLRRLVAGDDVQAVVS